MKILFFFFFSLLFCTHALSQISFGLRGGDGLLEYDYGEFIEGRIFFYSPTCVSETGNSEIKENKRIKRKVKDRLKNKLKKIAKHYKSDTVKKPDSFWTNVVLGLSFAALMLLINLPFAMLFFLIVTGIGLGGYYIFRKKNKKIAEAFLIFATALNFGLGVVAVYGIWLGSVVD